MGTPHNHAEIGDIAEKVLLPGDPMRAKFIAENFLEDAVCYNEVRGMYGFTGLYKGEKVSIQGTGMGMPSMHIYASELIQNYGAKKLIRIGTCGSLREGINLKDVVIAMASTTDSGMNKDRFGNISFAPTASFELLRNAYDKAKELNVHAVVSNIFTSDKFYDDHGKEKNWFPYAANCNLYGLSSTYINSVSVRIFLFPSFCINICAVL